ncbi:MAG: hypothetical protein ABI577_07300 [bacterium]
MRCVATARIPDKPTFGVRSAAEILGVSPSTVYEALYRKLLSFDEIAGN